MPKRTNPKAPLEDYPDGIKDKGAAFRDSITYDEALNKLVYEAFKTRFKNTFEGSRKSKPFNSDPWSAYTAKGKKGREFDLDNGQVWRLMKFDGAWFLAKHKGSHNEFEFWHISNPPGKTVALPSITTPSSPVAMNAPVVTSATLVTVHMPSQPSIPVLTKVDGQPLGEDDTWDSVAL